jgi:DtxR family transcriptional regulator, Mn-dependent transcriptional regulator
MEISKEAQEYLERLWIETQEDPLEEQTAAEDGNVIGELVKLGLLRHDDERHELTKKGEVEAGRAIRRHRLAERLFADVLVTEESLMDERACTLEHVLFDGVDEAICTLLGHPKFCPHGKPIPPGKCCEAMRNSVSRLIAPLNELKPGQEGKIAYIQMRNPNRLQKLMAMGVLPGVPVKLTHNFPSYVFEAGYSQFAVDAEIAGDIFVRLAG